MLYMICIYELMWQYYEYPISKPLLLSIWIGWPAMRKHWPKTTFYQLLSFFVIVLAFFWIHLLLYGNAVQASPPSFAFPSFLSLAGPSHRATYMLCNLVFESQILADLAKHWKLLAILNRNLAWNGKRVRQGVIKKIKATQVNKATSTFFSDDSYHKKSAKTRKNSSNSSCMNL